MIDYKADKGKSVDCENRFVYKGMATGLHTKFERRVKVKIIRLLVFGILISCCSTIFAQKRDVFVRLKHGLPNILKVTNVRIYSDSPTSAKISVWINVKKGKIVSVSRGGGDWIITLRTRGEVSTYVVSEKSFRIAGEGSKAVKIRAMHFAESS